MLHVVLLVVALGMDAATCAPEDARPRSALLVLLTEGCGFVRYRDGVDGTNAAPDQNVSGVEQWQLRAAAQHRFALQVVIELAFHALGATVKGGTDDDVRNMVRLPAGVHACKVSGRLFSQAAVYVSTVSGHPVMPSRFRSGAQIIFTRLRLRSDSSSPRRIAS